MVEGKFEFVIDSSAEACRKGCERSLERLGVESVDLFYVHRFDKVTPVEKTVEAMIELKRRVYSRYCLTKISIFIFIWVSFL